LKLSKLQPNNFDDCIRFSRNKFEDYFRNKSIELLFNFPLDHMEDGKPFWVSPKRPPTQIDFDFEDPQHKLFIISVSSLFAEVWGIERHKDEEQFKKILSAHKLPTFVPKKKKIETDRTKKKEDQKVEEEKIDESQVTNLLKEALTYFEKSTPKRLNPIDFEKDDDTNFHIDFISSVANIRARQYQITEVERLKVKHIAGRIIPAIATTTAAISGMVCIELIKVLEKRPVDQMKNLFMNLAEPFWAQSEPPPAKEEKLTDKISYTFWDQWQKKGDCTLNVFLLYFKKKYSLKVTAILRGGLIVFSPDFTPETQLNDKMSKLTARKDKEPYVNLTIQVEGQNGKDVSAPPFRFYFAK